MVFHSPLGNDRRFVCCELTSSRQFKKSSCGKFPAARQEFVHDSSLQVYKVVLTAVAFTSPNRSTILSVVIPVLLSFARKTLVSYSVFRVRSNNADIYVASTASSFLQLCFYHHVIGSHFLWRRAFQFHGLLISPHFMTHWMQPYHLVSTCMNTLHP